MDQPVDRALTDTQLMLPLLAELAQRGGVASPSDLYDGIAARLQISDDVRNRVVPVGAGAHTNAFERRVRWVRQSAIARGLLASPKRGMWEITSRGRYAVRNAKPGVVITLFETANGFVLWGDCRDVVGVIEESSIDLIVSSPPYPTRKPKPYGTMRSREWLDWMLRTVDGWRPLLTPTGSMFINVGQVWNEGQPTQDTYLERFIVALEDQLGLQLCQRFFWQSNCKMVAPMQWVAIERVRVKNSVEMFYWVAPTSRPKANTTPLLVPYSASGLRAMREPARSGTRPSGADSSTKSFRTNHGGAIPGSLIVANNSASNDRYHRRCRDLGIPAHPATMPARLAEFAIDLATDEGDTVADLLCGSGIVGRVAQDKNRKFIMADRSLTFLEGARVRFDDAVGAA